MKLKYKKLYDDAQTPVKGTEFASGFDLFAYEDVVLQPGETKLIKTGIAFELEFGTEIQVRPRSGLSLKTGLRVTNSPGTVDSDYTGECCVILQNTAPSTYLINKNDRIAQAVLCPVLMPELEEVDELNAKIRGSSGFGSTGK